MRNFIIFFDGKEGSSALVRQLDRFEQISMVCQDGGEAGTWEPFDHNACAAMTLLDRRRCFEFIFDEQPLDIDVLNRVYLKSAAYPLKTI